MKVIESAHMCLLALQLAGQQKETHEDDVASQQIAASISEVQAPRAHLDSAQEPRLMPLRFCPKSHCARLLSESMVATVASTPELPRHAGHPG